ncbi:AI-2E family transporter [Asticcacaulis endophyticus]|uniref:AI-2E family transporter n=1 Tax=Asticcacaulis endophyticus TaxID=1395890 RepID=A0A918URP4_9CAUL|nr:AI-2E family transporter [Asticcacaulis endophyticus]GGZ28747.1 AI-2E family transporter [Asticcacaulis endophyticus]
MSKHDSEGVTAGFIQRVLFILLIVALSALALKLVSIWLLIFGAIIVAVILRAVSEPLIRYLKVPEPVSILLALVILIAGLTGAFYFFGWQISRQIEDLWQQMPAAWDRLEVQINGTPTGTFVHEQIDSLGQKAGQLISMAPKIAGEVFATLANLVVAIVGGIFLAMRPGSYRDGIVMLFPKSQRALTKECLNDSGKSLQMWLLAQAFSMVLVGSLTAIGLSIVGVESALALGLISGLAQFVPIVGPIVSAGPGLLLAGSEGLPTFLWALAIYVGVSQLESNVITPMVQKHVASIPTVVTLFAVIAFGTLLGPMGILFATPLTVVIYTLVLKLYVGKVLDDPISAARAEPDTKETKTPGIFGFLKGLRR